MWKDVDLEKGVWQLNDTKTGIDRTVQLPTQAVTFLEQLKLVTGDCLFGVLGILPPYIAKTSEAPVCRGL
jgi:integrase